MAGIAATIAAVAASMIATMIAAVAALGIGDPASAKLPPATGAIASVNAMMPRATSFVVVAM